MILKKIMFSQENDRSTGGTMSDSWAIRLRLTSESPDPSLSAASSSTAICRLEVEAFHAVDRKERLNHEPRDAYGFNSPVLYGCYGNSQEACRGEYTNDKEFTQSPLYLEKDVVR